MLISTPSAPSLFKAEGTERFPTRPALLGGRCNACGMVFYPAQSYGCEACGSMDLSNFSISGAGRLVATAAVHLHTSPKRSAPFFVGSVVTDDGAFVRALLEEKGADELKPGDRVVTKLIPESREGFGSMDLRFTKE